MRVALLTNIISPYRVPVFRDLGATPGWDLRIFTNARSEFDRSWDVQAGDLPVEQIRSWSLRRKLKTRGAAGFSAVSTMHIPVGLPGALRRFRPDVIVSAELGVRSMLASAYAKLSGTPLVLWSYHSRSSSTDAGRLQRTVRRTLLKRADAIIGMGTQAREVLQGYGISGPHVFDAPNAADHDTCAARYAECADSDASRFLQETHGCRPNVLLNVGRLVPMKGIPHLLQAWGELPATLRRDWSLLFLGSGPMQPELEAARQAAEPGEIVHVDAVQPEEVARYYAGSRALVFPTLGDPWGLVVNEAMICERPVICSRLAGCADDMLTHGENGWLCDPTSNENMVQVLGEALTNARQRDFGPAARQTAERFRPHVMAAGMRAAIEYAHATRTQRSGKGMQPVGGAG